MAATMFGKVQVQHEILDCFTGLHEPEEGNNYLAIYIESRHEWTESYSYKRTLLAQEHTVQTGPV